MYAHSTTATSDGQASPEPEAIEVGTPRPNFTTNAVARFLAEGVILLLGQVAAIVIARSLGTTGKGLASLITLLSVIVFMVSDFGLTSAGVYFAGRKRHPLTTIAGTLFSTGLLVGFGFMMLLVALSPLIDRWMFHGTHRELIAVFALGVPLTVLYNWFSGILRGQEKIVLVSRINALGVAVYAAVLMILLLGFDSGPVAVAWGMNAIAVVGLTGTGAALLRQGIRPSLGIDGGLLREAVGFGLRGHVGQFLQFVNYRFDLLVVNYFFGVSSVGIYGVSVGVAQVIWQIPNALSYALYSRVSSVGKEEGDAITCKVARRSMLLSLLAAVLMAPVGTVAIPLLFGEAFRPGVLPMLVLLPGIVALSYYKTLGVYFAGQGKPEYCSYSAAMSVGITLALDFILIPRVGIVGASIASTAAYTITSIVCLWWFVRFSGMRRLSRLIVPDREDFTACAEVLGRIMGRKSVSGS